MNCQYLGENIRRIRKLKKIKRRELAAAVGISFQSLSRIEKGVNYPTFETLEKIMAVLEVTPNEILLGRNLEKEGEYKTEPKNSQYNSFCRGKKEMLEKMYDAHIAFDDVRDTKAMYSYRDKIEEKLDPESSELLSDYTEEVRRKGFEEGFQCAILLLMECLEIPRLFWICSDRGGRTRMDF